MILSPRSFSLTVLARQKLDDAGVPVQLLAALLILPIDILLPLIRDVFLPRK